MILVTGGSGLVGKELITQLLAKGEKIRAIYNKTPLADFHSSLIEQVHCDILDVISLEEIMQDIQQVYHCAAIVSFNPRHKQDLYKVYIEGTANIVNAALAANVKKMVHVSSVAALGRIRNNETVNEAMQWSEENNNSIYGKSKYFGEMEVWRGVGEGMNAVIVNPSLILGPGDWEASSSKIFKTVYNEFPWHSEGTTGFVDVRDVASAMIALMASDISAQRFILSGENATYKNVFRMIAKAFGKKPPHKNVTPFLAGVIWRLEAIKNAFTKGDPLVTKETAHTALSSVYYDSSKLLKFLPGFRFTDLEQTITHTCRVFQQKLNSR